MRRRRDEFFISSLGASSEPRLKQRGAEMQLLLQSRSKQRSHGTQSCLRFPVEVPSHPAGVPGAESHQHQTGADICRVSGESREKHQQHRWRCSCCCPSWTLAWVEAPLHHQREPVQEPAQEPSDSGRLHTTPMSPIGACSWVFRLVFLEA